MTKIMEKTNQIIGSIPPKHWELLDSKKIFFAHQSVGLNILGGVEELLKERLGIPLKIVKVTEPYQLVRGVLSHTTVGRNYDPRSKIEDFVGMVERGVGDQADIAFFKFCYIDFSAKTNPGEIFLEYKRAIEMLKQKYPKTKFIHVTVPLLKVETGPKAWVKKLLGKTLDGTADNVKRCEYNQMLRKEFGPTDPIFDIALYESTRPDGSRETFTLGGKRYYAMFPEYTSDGGHLNQIGSKYLAAALLKTLAKTISEVG